MSYDLTIAADERFSRSVPPQRVRAFLASLAGVQPNGPRSFVLRVGDRIWMEIEPESVTEDGDSTDDEEPPAINCIRLHIPYAALGENPDRDYFPTAIAIAGHLGWTATDEQTGGPIGSPTSQRAWWRFW